MVNIFFTVNVRCSDNGIPSLSIDATITIPIKDVNEAPYYINIDDTKSLVIPENFDADYVLGTLQCFDSDQKQTFTFEIQEESKKYFKVNL